MRRSGKKLLSLLLALVLCLGLLSLGAGASEEPGEQFTEISAEELTEAPAEEPAEESGEGPAEEPAEEPAEAPAEEPAEAPAEDGEQKPRTGSGTYKTSGGDTFSWSLEEGGVLTIGGGGTLTGIPTRYDLMEVLSSDHPSVREIVITPGFTAIECSLNYKENSVGATSVHIPGTVTSLGKNAFFKNDWVEHVYLSYGLQSIGDGAFYGCKSLREIDLPVTLREIGKSAFEASGLESVTVPHAVDTVGDNAFSRCNSLVSASVEGGSFGLSAFSKCDKLEEVYVDTEVLGKNMFSGCKLLSGAELGDSVREVGDSAFANCISLEDLTLGKNVKRLGSKAFYGCAILDGVDLPGGLEFIGESVFESCTALTAIRVPDTVTGSLYAAFRSCLALKSAEVGAAEIGSSCFKGCVNLKDVTLLEGVRKIESNAFAECAAIEELSFPDTLTELEDAAFKECTGLCRLTLGAGFTPELCRMLVGAYNLQFLQDIQVRETSETLKSVDGAVLTKDGTRLLLYPMFRQAESYAIPDGVVIIGQDAFWWSSYSAGGAIPPLRVLTIPSSVRYSDSYFYDADRYLTDIWFQGSEAAFRSITYSEYASSRDCSLVSAYERDAGYRDPLDYDAEFHFGEEALALGDVTGEGIVDTSDWNFLARALADVSGYTVPDADIADLNSDGALNRVDRILLARELAKQK